MKILLIGSQSRRFDSCMLNSNKLFWVEKLQGVSQVDDSLGLRMEDKTNSQDGKWGLTQEDGNSTENFR